MAPQLRAVAAATSALIASYRGAGDGGDNSPLYTLSPDDSALAHGGGASARAGAGAGLHEAPEGRPSAAKPVAASAAEGSLLL